MKKLIVTILLLVGSTTFASQKAITDTGDEVILNSDGTWFYSDNTKTTKSIETNKKKFARPRKASFLLKSTKTNSAFWIIPDKWSFKKGEVNADAEYEFELKGEDLYALAITEKIEIPVDALSDIALANARNNAPDAYIVKREYRNVNGKNVIYMEMNGTAQGVKFTYLGYYYSDSSGTTQLVTFTATNLVDKYRSEIDNFLNGLDTQ